MIPPDLRLLIRGQNVRTSQTERFSQSIVALKQQSQSSGGDIPTSGGARPGPGRLFVPPAPGVFPLSIMIPDAGVDAVIEQRRILEGVMQDPSGPWVVTWYLGTPKLGVPGNVLMAGHVDYWGVGPSVFADIEKLAVGNPIAVLGEDRNTYHYIVSWIRVFEANLPPTDEVVGPTEQPVLTLITCGGEPDRVNGGYLQRIVIRADFVDLTPTG